MREREGGEREWGRHKESEKRESGERERGREGMEGEKAGGGGGVGSGREEIERVPIGRYIHCTCTMYEHTAEIPHDHHATIYSTHV